MRVLVLAVDGAQAYKIVESLSGTAHELIVILKKKHILPFLPRVWLDQLIKLKNKAYFKYLGVEPFEQFFVSEIVSRKGIRSVEVESANSTKFLEVAKRFNPDLILVASWGEILKGEVLEEFEGSIVNTHTSLLPRHRGGTPLHWAILAGETEFGVTFHELVRKVDSGDILLQDSLELPEKLDVHEVHKKVAEFAGENAEELLERGESGNLEPRPQGEDGNYDPLWGKSHHNHLTNFSDAVKLERLVKANAKPYNHLGTHFKLGDSLVKIWGGVALNRPGREGEVTEIRTRSVVVGCGNNSIELVKLQKAGLFSRVVDAAPLFKREGLTEGDMVT